LIATAGPADRTLLEAKIAYTIVGGTVVFEGAGPRQ
jgi:hypothetical protein